MKRRSARRIALGLRWDGASWEGVPALMDHLLPRVADIPLHWCFTAPPAELRSALEERAPALRQRLTEGGDTLLPAGFRGSAHGLLALDELEKELAWSVANPWRTGIRDLFGVRTAGCAPLFPDFGRPRIFQSYEKSGFHFVGIERDGEAERWKADGLDLFSYRKVLAKASARSPSPEIRRAVGEKGDLLLMVEIPPAADKGTVGDFFEDLFRFIEAVGGECVTFGDVFSSRKISAAPFPSPASCSRIPAQLLRWKLALSSPLQKKRRKKGEEYLQILEGLSLPGDAASYREDARFPDASVRHPKGKTLVSHMQGEVTLAGMCFDARLTSGRFCGITRQGRFVLPNILAASFITINGKTYHFRSGSTVSFEGETGTGLRDDLVLEGSREIRDAAGHLTVEYEFRGDMPELFISAVVRYPRLSAVQTVDALAPLVISLIAAKGAEVAALHVVCPDGSEASYRITGADGWKGIPGMSWSLDSPEGRIFLHCAPPGERKWGLCFFRLVKRRGSSILEANPFGSPIPIAGRLVSGKVEALGLLIGLGERP
jgi:hypothetical protein